MSMLRLALTGAMVAAIPGIAGAQSAGSAGFSLRCPAAGVSVSNWGGGGGRSFAGAKPGDAAVCLVPGVDADNHPIRQEWLFQVFRLDYGPAGAGPEERAREDAIRAGLTPLAAAAASTDFTYFERSPAGTVNFFRERWRVLDRQTLALENGTSRPAFRVERRRDQPLDSAGSDTIWTYWFDEQTGAIARTVVTAVRGIIPAAPNAAVGSSHARTLSPGTN